MSRDARLERAVTEHHALVWRVLRRFGVAMGEMEDAAQLVYLTLSKHLERIEPGKEAAYLAAVSVKIAANVRRKVQRRREDPSSEIDERGGPSTPEALLDQKQLRRELDEGLATLTSAQRNVFVLFELEGFSLPEIAELLDIPLGTATSRLRRAREQFQAWLEARADAESLP